MRHTALATVAVAVTALALAGCSASSGADTPKATVTATTTAAQTPEVSTEQARTACVDAWAQVLDADVNADIDQPPTACQGLPAGDKLPLYIKGMEQRSEANRKEIDDCIQDPACTSVPIP